MSLSDQTTYAPAASPAVPDCRIWRLSVAQYHDMIRAGILTDNDPVELLEGWLVPKMMKNPPHAAVTELVRDTLHSVVPPGWHVRQQQPITLARSEPEPDLTIVRGRVRTTSSGTRAQRKLPSWWKSPMPRSSRTAALKKRIYAQAGIAVYWIVNLIDRRIEVYSQPSGPAGEPDYRRQEVFGPSDFIPLVIGAEIGRVAAQELLP